MRVAVIDLGTNTFNLLIAEVGESGEVRFIHKSKLVAKLGKGGINEHRISKEAMNRGIELLRLLSETIHAHNTDRIFAYATSAIRSAKNGREFTERVRTELGIDITVISGEREAELIYKGVKHAIKLSDEKALIIDIGGGSVEFIIADTRTIINKWSINIGMARVLEKFNPSDPVTGEEILAIENYYASELAPLKGELQKHNVTTLIGSSGSFDTFADMLTNRKETPAGERSGFEIPLDHYFRLHDRLVNSTIKERSLMKGMELMRVEMIVLASILVNYIITDFNITRLLQSEYAIKEGVIFELVKENLAVT